MHVASLVSVHQLIHSLLRTALQVPGAAGQAQRSLADIIMDKIRAQQAASGQPSPSE